MKGIFALVVLCSIGASANTSTYQWQSERFDTDAEILVSREQGTVGFPAPAAGGTIGGEVTGEKYQVNLASQIFEDFQLQGGVAFANRKIATSQSSYNVSGLTNLQVAAIKTKPFDSFVLSYGLDTSVSLMRPRIEAVADKDGPSTRWRNNSDGYNSYAAFIGSEFIIGKANLGVRGSLVQFQSLFTADEFTSPTTVVDADGTPLYDDTTLRDNLSTNYRGVGLNIYAELPVHKQVNLGLAAGSTSLVQENVSNFNDIVTGKAANSTFSKIYGLYSYDEATQFILGLASETRRVYYDTDKTEFTLGVVRSL